MLFCNVKKVAPIYLFTEVLRTAGTLISSQMVPRYILLVLPRDKEMAR